MVDEGARIVLNDVDAEALEKTAEEMGERGKSVLAVQADVSNAQQVGQMVLL